MNQRIYSIKLKIESANKYKTYLEKIAFDWSGVSDNIGYHFTYLHYLYQIHRQISLPSYKAIHCLRIKTIVVELASIAELLLYDAVCNLIVQDQWDRRSDFYLDAKVGFAIILDYAFRYKVITKELKGRLHRLFELRHMIHLTHKKRDPDQFNEKLLKDSEMSVEDLIRYFVSTRQRDLNEEQKINPNELVFPWQEFS